MFVDPNDDSNTLSDKDDTQEKPDDVVEDVLSQTGVHDPEEIKKPDDIVEDVLDQTGTHDK